MTRSGGATQPVAFPRREFLLGSVSAAALVALGWTTLPGLPDLIKASSQRFPDYVYASGALKAYRIAVNNQGLFAKLPCYCGCATYVPAHTSLLDCFLQPNGGFEAHAAGCTTCQQEALAAQQWVSQGFAIDEVRRRLDAAYHDRGPSTDTKI